MYLRSLILAFGLTVSSLAITGCSSWMPDRVHGGSSSLRGECAPNPTACIYRGRYEPGERYFAQKEAARLNRQSLERLKAQASAF